LDDVGEDGAFARLRPRRVVWCGRAGVQVKGKPGPLAHITGITAPRIGAVAPVSGSPGRQAEAEVCFGQTKTPPVPGRSKIGL